MKRVFKQQDSQLFCFKLIKYCNFHPLEVVGRGSETQLQAGENLNYLFFCAIKVKFLIQVSAQNADKVINVDLR